MDGEPNTLAGDVPKRSPLSLVKHGEPRRWSLRLRMIAALIAVALAPQILVFAYSQFARKTTGKLWGRARDAMVAASAVLGRNRGELPGPELSRVAQEHKVRLRIYAGDQPAALDVDADDPTAPYSWVERFFLGDQDQPGLREIDQELGPIDDRLAVQEARRKGRFIGCQAPGIVYCEAIESLEDADHPAGSRLVYVQTSSHRAVVAVYELRHHLMRLGILTVPLAFALAIYTGRRLVRPIERLRRQALEKATLASPNAVLESERSDEIGDLAEAFNTLVLALEKKRTENEAFVADLVHEFKNPVAAVRASADALASGPHDAERAARLSRVLRASSEKLDQLVTQFLELARAEAGMPNEERTLVDIVSLTRGLLDAMRDDARYSAVEFSFDGPGACERAWVLGVEHRLDALVRELLTNGASFAGEGGTVRAVVAVEMHHILLTVQDSGPGIAEEVLPRVFTRFFTTRGQRRGTGLGLALVRAVAEAHGGMVAAHSQPGEGAAFEIRLPRVRPMCT